MSPPDRRAFLKTATATAAACFVSPLAAVAQSENNRFKVAIIGSTGRGDYGHGIDTVWRDVMRANVVAVADDDEAGRGEAARRTGAPSLYADYREMLDAERPDVVAIGPRWLDQHRDMCLAAAERSCHIFLEKPFCRDLTEADEIVQACETHGVKLAIAHQTRWSPPVEIVRREIANGIIGRVLEIRTRGKEDARGGGLDLWVLGSHVLDLMRFFAGDPQTCYARVLTDGKPATQADVTEGDEGIGPLMGDAVDAMYALPNNVVGHFGSRRAAAGNPSRFGLQIVGTEGVIEVLTGHPAVCHVLQDPSWSPGRSGKAWIPITSNGVGRPGTLPAGAHHANALAVNDLLDCIGHAERQPRCDVYDARWTVEMIAAVFESHRLQRPVTLPLTDRRNPLGLS
ncbi:MAG: Gfo/Idh/MocA family oxidoreductase [Planctomycetota bacterium]|nr:Gfo/Idh/MocA family oxidoreductase [Planctomycetaceae bacterium]MDQ3332953.1 Gfo/Idh/MocA family oxidoreductase [Planctomycetota bacterium]